MPIDILTSGYGFSSITKIILVNKDNQDVLDIMQRNPQCQFERIEFAENVTDIFPTGALILRDQINITAYIQTNNINQIKLTYADNTSSVFDITSTAYINNAASQTEQVIVSVYFTNLFYKYSQTHSLNQELLKLDSAWASPRVYRVYDMVQYISNKVLSDAVKVKNPRATGDMLFADIEPLAGIGLPGVGSDAGTTTTTTTGTLKAVSTSNFVVYRPLNTKEYRIESPTDNPIQYLNYLSSMATGVNNGGPRFLFWTDFSNKVNFKYFGTDINTDPTASDSTIDKNNLRFAVYNSDSPTQKLSDGKTYRKINFLRTDPNNQYVSKNYHYIRKTPKLYDVLPSNVGATYYANALSYQFQDEGQKYNIELINSKGLTGATAGSDELVSESHWGYYNELEPLNDGRSLTHLGQNFGNNASFSSLNYMGNTGYFPFVDNPEMWKNMFDMTEVHPHYPDERTLTNGNILGKNTHLQEILTIRYLVILDQTKNRIRHRSSRIDETN
jgi:hypothetical protein